MIAKLAFRNLVLRPWRSAFLLFGYSLGVSVMIVLLSIGEALLTQARDEKLVGGGDVTVLPEGIDVELLKTGGLGGMFFSIDHARFVYQQLLAAPRLAPFVQAVAPQIEGKLLYARTLTGREWPVMANGEIPSAHARRSARCRRSRLAIGATTVPIATWVDPQLNELRNSIDHFHLPPAAARRDPTWAEWHYFNVLSADRMRWAFISLIVAGQVPDGAWGGQVLVTLHTQGGPTRRFVATVPSSAVRLSTSSADLSVGSSSVAVLADGRYAVRAKAAEEHGDGVVDVNLAVTPAPRAYFPGAALSSGETVSGYVVPGLRAERDRIDLREWSLRAFRRCAVVSRPQLGRLAWGDVGVGRGARRRVHAALRSRAARGQLRRVAAVVRLRRRLAWLSRTVSSARDSV